MLMLNVQGLYFSYNCRPVLSGIEFSVKKGEILAILGPNGVGKTTLLKCINSIHRPEAGIVTVDGNDVLGMNSEQVAREISYVPQHSERTCLTVFDAILMGRKPYIRWKVAKEDILKVNATLSHLHLEDYAMRNISELSGGELQKVAIARALVQDPHLLLLDEPTSALDLKNQYDILTLLKWVVEMHDISAVMTMHDLNTAMRFADKFLFLRAGKVYAYGNVEDITPDIINEVYGLTVDIHTYTGIPVVVPQSNPMRPYP